MVKFVYIVEQCIFSGDQPDDASSELIKLIATDFVAALQRLFFQDEALQPNFFMRDLSDKQLEKKELLTLLEKIATTVENPIFLFIAHTADGLSFTSRVQHTLCHEDNNLVSDEVVEDSYKFSWEDVARTLLLPPANGAQQSPVEIWTLGCFQGNVDVPFSFVKLEAQRSNTSLRALDFRSFGTEVAEPGLSNGNTTITLFEAISTLDLYANTFGSKVRRGIQRLTASLVAKGISCIFSPNPVIQGDVAYHYSDVVLGGTKAVVKVDPITRIVGEYKLSAKGLELRPSQKTRQSSSSRFLQTKVEATLTKRPKKKKDIASNSVSTSGIYSIEPDVHKNGKYDGNEREFYKQMLKAVLSHVNLTVPPSELNLILAQNIVTPKIFGKEYQLDLLPPST